MLFRITFTVLLFCCTGSFPAQHDLNRAGYYQALRGKDLQAMDAQLDVLQEQKRPAAFAGALRMRKSGFVSPAKAQLLLFKSGRDQLEASIAADSTNAEYRFLRLLVQENAPKLVKYNSEIEKDAAYLRKNYRTLPPAAQKAVLHYSKSSKVLSEADFKNDVHE